MKRDAEKEMLSWFEMARRKPLVLRGARQVGKSTLVRQFAASQGLVLNEVNLERHLNLARVFATTDIPRILDELDVIVGRKIDQPNSLLFLDEIQAVPEAIAALRYFYEDRPHLPVVSAGSLLEFALDAKRLSMPVGRVTYMYLGPMTFCEFLAETAPDLIPYARQAAAGEPVPQTAHEKLTASMRRYLFVGGMPEAVLAYVESGLTAVSEVQRMILESYEDDFAKYAHGMDLALMQEIFRNLSPQACKKVKYVNFSREVGSRAVKGVLNLFLKSRVLTRVRASACTGLPLYADTEEGVWKGLFLDVGLMNRACGVDWRMLERMDDVKFVNEGAMAEQYIGQQLLSRNGCLERPMLAYWLREGGKNNAEVDFVVSYGDEIIPIEVKAGAAGSLKSLRELLCARGYAKAIRFDMNPPSRQIVKMTGTGIASEYTLISRPLYTAPFLNEILDCAFDESSSG